MDALPPEVWDNILDGSFTAHGLKSLSLVCGWLRNLCQSLLFREISVSLSLEKGHALVSHLFPQFGGQVKRDCIQGYDWDRWKKQMFRIQRAERRIALLGSDPALACTLRSLKLQGYVTSQSANTHLPPGASKPVSGAIYEAFARLRQTLSHQLPSFNNLGRLELSGCPIEEGLLVAISRHPRLSELSFARCSFPISKSPLLNITSLAYTTVDECQVSAAYNLISIPHIRHLTFRLDRNSHSLHALSKTFSKANARYTSLRSLHLHLNTEGDDDSIHRILSFTPALHELTIEEKHSSPTYSGPAHSPPRALPSEDLPELRTLTCSLDRARAIVPGRPIVSLRLLGEPSQTFTSSTQVLDSTFEPLTQSTAALTPLHLPQPTTPIWLLSPFLAKNFPHVQDFRPVVTICHNVAAASTNNAMFRPAFDGRDTYDPAMEVVEEGVINRMMDEVRGAAEDDLSGLVPRTRAKHIGQN